jgi:hypothetical protein
MDSDPTSRKWQVPGTDRLEYTIVPGFSGHASFSRAPGKSANACLTHPAGNLQKNRTGDKFSSIFCLFGDFKDSVEMKMPSWRSCTEVQVSRQNPRPRIGPANPPQSDTRIGQGDRNLIFVLFNLGRTRPCPPSTLSPCFS